MENIRNQLCGRIQLFAVCASQCVLLGFDSTFLLLLLHVQLVGPLLLVGNCVFGGSMLLAAVSVWMNAFGRWDTWASCFLLLSTKAVAWSAVAIPFFPPLFLALLAPLGFCIAAQQSLILDLAVRRIPNPAKKLLIALCFTCISLGSFAAALLLDQTAAESGRANEWIPRANSSLFYSNYKSFNVLQQIHVTTRVPLSYVAVGVSILHSFCGYAVFDLWKQKTNDSRPTANEEAGGQEEQKAEQLGHVHVIGAMFSFLSSGLFCIFPYFVMGLALPSFGVIYFYAFLAGCLASRVLFLTFASKFPVMFWLGCAMLMCGVATCGLGFEPTKSVASAFFGMGVSLVLPVVTTLFSKTKGASVHPLLVGMISSSLVSPLAMTQVVQIYGPELFTSFNLFAVFLMVCLFVGLLNVQSSTERPPDEKHARVWIFFQGQGMKRTRSIRKFIGSLRGSLRGSRYRRLHRHQRSPLPPADSSLLGPNPIATRSYRSTESARRQRKSLLEANPPRHNSLDKEEETQIDCLSPTTPSPVFFSNPNHTSTH